MAEATKKSKKSSAPAAQSHAPEVLERLAQADESITRMSEDVKARKIERAKEMRRSESEAKAQREQTRAERAAQKKQSELIAEQKLAAFYYAENYRKKLLKDKEKMVSSAKQREQQARLEAEERARAEKARELELIREREHEQARQRNDRAAALLNRVTKCAVVGDDGNVRMVDRSELARIEAERAAAMAAEAEAKRLEAEAAAAAEAAEKELEKESEKETEIASYPDKEEIVSSIISAFRQTSPLFKEYEDRAREEIAARRVEEFFEGEMMDTRDGKFVLNIIEDDFTVQVTDEDDENILSQNATLADDDGTPPYGQDAEDGIEDDEYESSEPDEADDDEDAEDEVTESVYPPVTAISPLVLELRDMASQVFYDSEFKKYLRRVKKVTKRINKRIEGMEAGTKSNYSEMLPSAIIEEVLIFIELINIRCDALMTCVLRKAKKAATKQAQSLYIEIDGYNDVVSMFKSSTGEELTSISSFLPEYLLAGTGLPVIPAYEYREHYIELLLNSPKKKSDPYTLVFPSLKEMANGKPIVATPIDPNYNRNANRVTTKAIIAAPMSAASVYSDDVETYRSYRKHVRKGNKVTKTLNAYIENVAAQMERTEETASAAIDLLNLQKEKVMIAFYRLANAMKTERIKYIMQAKDYVLKVMREYNRYAKKYTNCIGIDLAKFDTSLPEYILRTGVVPQMPRFAYCIELFETVGDETRLVGEHKEDEDNGYAFVFGADASPAAPMPNPVAGMPAQPNPVIPNSVGGAPAPAAPGNAPSSGISDTSGRGKKKYMAANDSDTVYLTIPFDNGSESQKPKKKKKNESVYTPDAPVTLVTSEGETPISIGGATISVVTEKEPAPVNVEKSTAKRRANDPKPQPQPPMITQDTINTLAQALSDAVKIAEYAKAAEHYAHSAERAAKMAEEAGTGKAVNNSGIYDNTVVPQPIVMENSTRSNYDAVKRIAKSQLRGFIINTEKKLANARREATKAEAIREAGRPDARPRLTVACLAPSKAIIDSLSDMLAAYSNILDTDGINKTKKDLLLEINNYNRLISEYEKLTGGKLTAASLEMVEDIIAGRPYDSLPEVKFIGRDRDLKDRSKSVLAVTESTAPAPTRDMKIINREQLRAYLSRSGRELSKYERALSSASGRIAGSKDQDRAIAIVDAIIATRNIINLLCENLVAACQVSAISESSKIKRMIGTQIKEYNALVKELERTSGDQLTPASEQMAQEIITGMSYQPLPEIKYDIVNPQPDKVDKINKAIVEGKELYKDEMEKEGHINLGTVSAKIAAQANKDVGVVVNCAAFEISVLESERDILRYGYGGELARFGKQRKVIAKKIAAIKRNHAKAIRCAEEDNQRYYQVVTNNPATVETKRSNPNRKRLAELRTRMIALLNERDKINSKLTAIYTGEEYNLDGTGINQTWRRVKADSIERQVKWDRFVAREIKHLPASDSEKARIYDLMNKRLDAISTNALCKYRLRKEYLHEGEWNKVVKDMREAKKLKKRLDEEIDVLVKRIYKRYKESGIASAWLTGMGFFLLFAMICVIAYILLFNTDIIDSIRTIKSFLGL